MYFERKKVSKIRDFSAKFKLSKIKKFKKIIFVDTPVEEFLEKNGFKTLIGFSSSVLFNFKNSNIEVIQIKYKDNWLGIDCQIAYDILRNYL